MRKWLAGKFFDWAVRLDWEVTVIRAQLVMKVERGLQETFMMELGMTERTHFWVPAKEKDRAARKDAKDRLARKAPTLPKKRGRPLGSKNKPKVQP